MTATEYSTLLNSYITVNKDDAWLKTTFGGTVQLNQNLIKLVHYLYKEPCWTLRKYLDDPNVINDWHKLLLKKLADNDINTEYCFTFQKYESIPDFDKLKFPDEVTICEHDCNTNCTYIRSLYKDTVTLRSHNTVTLIMNKGGYIEVKKILIKAPNSLSLWASTFVKQNVV